jgi:hypothetical protein
MITTIEEQKFYSGTEQKIGFLYAEINSYLFSENDNIIQVQRVIGEKKSKYDDVLQDNIETFEPLSVSVINYTDQEFKELIESTRTDFNSPVTNLLLQEFAKLSDNLILKDIELNPKNYFGITVENWTSSKAVPSK